MAKYTETLLDYIQAGGTLPALFEDIPGFADLFVQRFCDYEIGFETPELFSQKLEGAAKIHIPYYKKLIDAQSTLISKLSTGYDREHITTTTLGEQDSKSWAYPFNGTSDVNPAARTLSTQTVNTASERSTAYTPDELARMIELAESVKRNILEELLDKFKTCFMIIF